MSSSSPTDVDITIDSALVPPKKLRLGVMTWNMGNAQPSEGWLSTAYPNGAEDYDMIVFGLQESTFAIEGKPKRGSISSISDVFNVGKADVDTASGDEGDETPTTSKRSSRHHRSKSLLSNMTTLGCIDFIEEAILNEFTDFSIVEHAVRAQMQLFVLIRTNFMNHVSDVSVQVENTGFAHIFPNKGGLLVDFRVCGTSFAFISCHLTAHEGVRNCEMRNASVKEILGGVRAGDTRFDISGQRHHVFWMGDMNYRLTSDPTLPRASKRNESLSEEELRKFRGEYDELEKENEEETGEHAVTEHRQKVYELLCKNDWKHLLQMDELNREIKDNRALKGFTALTPNFPPTFKRIRDISIANPASDITQDKISEYYHPKRCPSYTDRILHRSMPLFEGNLSTESFVSFESITSSDHKPVRGSFTLNLTNGAKGIRVPQLVPQYLEKNMISKMIKDKHGIEICISEMKCKDLAEMDMAVTIGGKTIGGLSDPYILVTSEPPNLVATKLMVKSSTIMHNLNPVWPESEVIRVPIVTNDIENLCKEAHLLLSVWDYDYSNDDDLIGLARIPLTNCITSDNFELVDEPLYENGEIQGYLSCKIAMLGNLPKVQHVAEGLVHSTVTLDQIVIPEPSMFTNCCTMH